jgi:hypothetical protein
VESYTASAVSGVGGPPRTETLADIIGRLLARAESVENAVDRVTNRLVAPQGPVGQAKSDGSTAGLSGIAETDLQRAFRTLSRTESQLEFLEARLG